MLLLLCARIVCSVQNQGLRIQFNTLIIPTTGTGIDIVLLLLLLLLLFIFIVKSSDLSQYATIRILVLYYQFLMPYIFVLNTMLRLQG